MKSFPFFKFCNTSGDSADRQEGQSLHSHNGGEYISKPFQDFCDLKGIKRELTTPYNPPQNGVAERMNRTIQEGP